MATLQITRDEFMDAVENGIRVATQPENEHQLTGAQIARLRAVAISAEQALVGKFSDAEYGCPVVQAGGSIVAGNCIWDAGLIFACGFDSAIHRLIRNDRGIDVPEHIDRVVVR